MIDYQLTFSDHITKTARSCRFEKDQALSRPFGTCFTTPCSSSCSVQAGLLQCSLGRSSSQFYQTFTINPECSSKINFNEPKLMHITPLLIKLHWLPIAAHIKFKALMFAYKSTTGYAPVYLNSLLQTYMLSRSLRSASEHRLIVPSQRGTKCLSQTFK